MNAEIKKRMELLLSFKKEAARISCDLNGHGAMLATELAEEFRGARAIGALKKPLNAESEIDVLLGSTKVDLVSPEEELLDRCAEAEQLFWAFADEPPLRKGSIYRWNLTLSRLHGAAQEGLIVCGRINNLFGRTWIARKLEQRGESFIDCSPEGYLRLMGLARLVSAYLIQCSVAIEMMLSEEKEYSAIGRKFAQRRERALSK